MAVDGRLGARVACTIGAAFYVCAAAVMYVLSFGPSRHF